VLSPKDFITARLTGRVATDRLTSVRLVEAAGARYLDEAVGLVDGLAERLPPLAEPDFVLGQTEGAEVVVGTMDAFGTVYGAGTTSPGRGMVSCGTSVVVAGASELSVPVAGIVTFPPSRGVFVHAGPTQAGGDALRWWSRVSGLPIEDVLAEAAKSSPGANGLVFTPHLMGERAPLWDSDVRGSFFGLSSDTTGSDLARAVLEGVAMSARQIVGPVEEACGGPLESITLSGGGARSDLWAQVFADVLRRPVERLAVLDSAVLGAALLGGVGAGLHPDIETAAREAVAVERVFVPGVDVYEPLYRAYTVSYGALAGVHAELSGWRGNVRAVLEV
jgi:xylulokinase